MVAVLQAPQHRQVLVSQQDTEMQVAQVLRHSQVLVAAVLAAQA
jgi:hypothetical protein